MAFRFQASMAGAEAAPSSPTDEELARAVQDQVGMKQLEHPWNTAKGQALVNSNFALRKKSRANQSAWGAIEKRPAAHGKELKDW